MYLCIHTNTEIDHHQFFVNKADAEEQYPLWVLECVNRGWPWQPYKGEEPFAFPKPAVELSMEPEKETLDEE